MSEYQGSSPGEQELARFENDLPAWLAGQLNDSDASWMEVMQTRHKALALQALWLRDARAVIREDAEAQNTDAAFALLEKRIQADRPVPVSESPRKLSAAAEPKVAGWLRWLLGHPGWANAAAALAVVLVVGQATWIALEPGHESSLGPSRERAGAGLDADTPAWRALDLDDLQALGSGVRIQLRLKAQSLGSDLAAIARDLNGDAPAAWLAQPDGSWQLHLAQRPENAQALLEKLKANPQIEQAQLLP